MNVEQEERLNKLADLLDTIPESQYDQHVWGENLQVPEGVEIPEGEDVTIELTTAHCGSSACALGWASALWPWKFALMLSKDYYGNIDELASMCVFDDDKEAHIVWPEFEEYSGVGNDLVVQFFGLTYEEADAVFGPNENEDGDKPTPKEKAKEIRDIIAAHQNQS